MNFDKYIDNPSGGTSVYTNRRMYKDMYSRKFNALLVREKGQIEYELYRTGVSAKPEIFYVYIKIPSEIVPKFYYDVVIEFSTKSNKIRNTNNLREYDVKFYSNDPAFVYTFAHSFIKNDLFIKDLKPKMAKDSIKHVAKTRNPKNEVWYVKSLYFAYLAMDRYNLFSKIQFDRSAKKYDKAKLLRKIMKAEDKVALRQSEGEKIRKQRIEDKKRKAREGKKPSNQHIAAKKSNISKPTKTPKTSKVTKISNVTKKSKITGKNKKQK